MSERKVAVTVFEGGVYGKVVYDPWPTNPRTMMDCASTLLGLGPRTDVHSDKHATRYHFLCEVRKHPRFCPSWEDEDHRSYRDFSDIEVLVATARQLGFLVVPIDPRACVLGDFDSPVEWGHDAIFYMSPEKIHEEWGKGPKAYRKARNYLLAEIDEYVSYLSGDVFGVEVGTYHVDETNAECEDDGKVLDERHAEEVWGIVGLSWAEQEMNTMIHGIQQHLARTCPVLAEIQA